MRGRESIFEWAYCRWFPNLSCQTIPFLWRTWIETLRKVLGSCISRQVTACFRRAYFGQWICGIGYLVCSGARLLLHLKKSTRSLHHLLLLNNSQPSSLYIFFLEVPFHAPVIAKPAEYWTNSSLSIWRCKVMSWLKSHTSCGIW